VGVSIAMAFNNESSISLRTPWKRKNRGCASKVLHMLNKYGNLNSHVKSMFHG
jgi:hypothetical protein